MTAADRVFSDRYRLDEPLGAGGMGVVWRGHDLWLDRPVAIKELAGPWLHDETAGVRFEREARVTARLAHPNIVAVYDVSLHAGARFLVMELVEGQNVARLLAAEGPLSVDRAVAIAVQTCDGLSAAHTVGIIHRDIKPANLMINPEGVVKICDFGIARSLSGMPDAGVTGPIHAMGTSYYMAPERISGGLVDYRADLYSLGCTLYTMLAGTTPFSGEVSEVVSGHLHDDPVPLRGHRTDIPLALDALVAQLLAKAPAERPGSAAEVRARLMASIHDLTMAGMPVTSDREFASSAPHAGLTPASVVRPMRPGPVAGRMAGIDSFRLRHLGMSVAGLMIALIACVVSVVAIGQAGTGPTGAASPLAEILSPTNQTSAPQSPTPASSSPSVVAQSPTRVPAVPAALTSTAPVANPIALLRLAIREQVETGNLNPDKAGDLYKRVDDIARLLGAGNLNEVSKTIKAFQDRLTALRRDGQLTSSGYDLLSRRLGAVQLPPT